MTYLYTISTTKVTCFSYLIVYYYCLHVFAITYQKYWIRQIKKSYGWGKEHTKIMFSLNIIALHEAWDVMFSKNLCRLSSFFSFSCFIVYFYFFFSRRKELYAHQKPKNRRNVCKYTDHVPLFVSSSLLLFLCFFWLRYEEVHLFAEKTSESDTVPLVPYTWRYDNNSIMSTRMHSGCNRYLFNTQLRCFDCLPLCLSVLCVV